MELIEIGKAKTVGYKIFEINTDLYGIIGGDEINGANPQKKIFYYSSHYIDKEIPQPTNDDTDLIGFIGGDYAESVTEAKEKIKDMNTNYRDWMKKTPPDEDIVWMRYGGRKKSRLCTKTKKRRRRNKKQSRRK